LNSSGTPRINKVAPKIRKRPEISGAHMFTRDDALHEALNDVIGRPTGSFARCPLIGVMMQSAMRPSNTALIVVDAESAAPYAQGASPTQRRRCWPPISS
jgi:hypothetical protein